MAELGSYQAVATEAWQSSWGSLAPVIETSTSTAAKGFATERCQPASAAVKTEFAVEALVSTATVTTTAADSKASTAATASIKVAARATEAA